VWGFEKLFGIPAGHTLRQVEPPESRESTRWEHEEYDSEGKLVAVYESWLRDKDALSFVKFSPNGWVLSISGRSPCLPPRRVPVGTGVAAPPVLPASDVGQQHGNREAAWTP